MNMFSNIAPEDALIIAELAEIIDISSAERLAKGHESKYRVVTSRGKRRLLRVNDTTHYDWLEGDYNMYAYVAAAGINVMRPVAMGKFHNGELAYQLYTWLEGEDLAAALPRMSEREKYATGIKAGRAMRALHALMPMGDTEPWEARFGGKIRAAIEYMRANPGICKHGELLADYVIKNAALYENRPLSFTHGDWNPENIMLTSTGEIAVIDLSGENDYGDPWWEFRDILSDENAFPEFYTGQIDGYFDGAPPREFFKLLSVYVAFCAVEFLKYREDDSTPDQTETVMEWFDNMRNPVPTWYAPICQRRQRQDRPESI